MKTVKKQISQLTRKVTVRFKPEEYTRVHASFSRTTKRKLSEYIRYVLLEKPVTVYTRDKSIDELMEQLILLKNELSAIGNNYNQSVKKLHSMNPNNDLKSWAAENEKQRAIFIEKTSEIQTQIAKISEQWLQE